jgi:hypothetical protein
MRWWSLLVMLAACGRIGFDGVPAGDEPLGIEVDAFETTSPTFVPVPGGTLTLPPSPHRYLLLATATLQSSSFAEIAAELRYTVDNVERGMGGTQNTDANHPGPFEHFVVIDGTPVAQTVAFELRDASGGRARVEQLRAYAVELTNGVYAASDAIVPITTSAYVTAASFDLALPPGEYLFLAVVNASDAPGSSDIYTRWLGVTNSEVAEENHMPRGAWQSLLEVWRETVTTTSVVRLEAKRGNDTSQVRNARVLAIRTSDLAIDYSAKQVTVATTTSRQIDELVPTVTGNLYLRFASLRIEADCNTNTEPAIRTAVFDGTGVQLARIDHVNDNCGYDATYGVVELLRARPSRLVTTLRSENMQNVRASDSTILLGAF